MFDFNHYNISTIHSNLLKKLYNYLSIIIVCLPINDKLIDFNNFLELFWDVCLRLGNCLYCCIALIQLYVYICKYMRNIIKHKMTNFNERTNTLLYKNIITLTLFSEGWCCCVWEMSWRLGRTAILTPSSSSTIAALLSHLGWGCSTVGQPKALCLPLALNLASCLQLTRTVLHLVILLNVHLLFFCLFTQVHLLIDNSVEGQYITLLYISINIHFLRLFVYI